ncbi:uncharacterized protein CXorf49 homolog isoform X2 [Fukomys damarensis]|uniref:uncharacterized protein CXorf49 homolog isoform X2 n=1 Tax=Fukomys damarensis TaxID=885580 RepID=UPI00054002AF|nr:uncharacterized protein CXorf49 homolog isoform X2 [Fukomys damarensis]
MSSPRDVSSRGTDFGPEAGEHTEFRPANPTPRRRRQRQARVLWRDSWSPRGNEGEGVVSGHEGEHSIDLPADILPELTSEFEEELTVSRRAVLRGCEGRPGSPADEEEDAPLDSIPYVNIERASVVRQMSNMEAQGTRRYSSRFPALYVETGAAELPSRRVDAKAGPSRRGAMPLSRVQRQRHSAVPLHPSGPKRGQVWGNLKRTTESRVVVSRDAQLPSSDSDPESKPSDEFHGMQPIRVCISRKGGGQAGSTDSKEPEGVTRDLNIHAQASVPPLQGSLMISAPRKLPSAMGRQASGQMEVSSSKKMQNVVWAKAEGGPNYPGAGAITGAPPRAPTWKKDQEKKSARGGSKIILGRAFTAQGQRFRFIPPEPATLPPISGIQLLGTPRGSTSLTSGSKQGGPGRKSLARRARESQPVVGEDGDANTDPAPQAQVPAVSQPLMMTTTTTMTMTTTTTTTTTTSQGGLPSRVPVLSDDQEPTVLAPILERQQPLPGAQGCSQCLVLQKEIDDLKKQLAALHSLIDKFQTLGN